VEGVIVDTSEERIPGLVRNLLFKGKYEEYECRLVNNNLRPGDRVLEIGCGIGLVSLVATKVVGEGNVFSYEANPAMEGLIRDNYRLNGWEPNLFMKAITADGRRLTFFQQDNVLSSSLIDRKMAGREIRIESVAINDAIVRHRPTAIVMDVEGAEEEILPVADLSGVRALILELHPHIIGEERVAELVKGLEEQGFGVREKSHKTWYLER
jgi:FkbM family methyltransferase